MKTKKAKKEKVKTALTPSHFNNRVGDLECGIYKLRKDLSDRVSELNDVTHNLDGRLENTEKTILAMRGVYADEIFTLKSLCLLFGGLHLATLAFVLFQLFQ